MKTSWSLACIAAVVVLTTGNAEAKETSRVERPGTVGLGLYGGYGALTGDSRLGLDFKGGGGYGIDLRYVASRKWTLGLQFQNHTYAPDTSDPSVDRLVVTSFMGEAYFYRQRGQDVSNYLVLGAGFYRPEVHFNQTVGADVRESVAFPGENLVVSGGLGADIFIRENWGFNLGGRAYMFVGDGVSREEELDPNSLAVSNGNLAFAFHGQAGLFYYLLK